jgi:hypothetical protein
VVDTQIGAAPTALHPRGILSRFWHEQVLGWLDRWCKSQG